MRLALLPAFLIAALLAPAAAQSLDPSFGADGYADGLTTEATVTADLALDAKDRTYVLSNGGYHPNGNSVHFLSRIAPDGRADDTFAGIGTIRIEDSHGVAHAVVPIPEEAVTAGGGVVVAMRAGAFPRAQLRVYEQYGAYVRHIQFGTGQQYGEAVDAEWDTDLLVMAYRLFRNQPEPDVCGLYRTAVAAGGEAPPFGTDGSVLFPTAFECRALGVERLADGRYALGVSLSDGGSYQAAGVLVVMPDGTPDASFADGGVAIHVLPEDVPADFRRFEVDDAGRFVIGGIATKGDGTLDLAVLRLRADGSADASFSRGLVLYGGTDTTDVVTPEAFDMALRTGGGVLASLTTAPPRRLTLAALADDGTLDAGFGAGGWLTVASATGADTQGGGVGVDTKGRILAAGTARTDSTVVGLVAVRLATATTAAETAPDLAGTLTVAPNPAAGDARVALTLDAPTTATVRVVDALGRTVATLADDALGAGEHTFTVGRLAPGVYAVVAEAGDARSVARLTVIR